MREGNRKAKGEKESEVGEGKGDGKIKLFAL